jgi:hypothetical protein
VFLGSEKCASVYGYMQISFSDITQFYFRYILKSSSILSCWNPQDLHVKFSRTESNAGASFINHRTAALGLKLCLFFSEPLFTVYIGVFYNSEQASKRQFEP